MAEKSQGLVAHVIALEKTVVKKLSSKSEEKRSNKIPATAQATAHGIFPDSPPIFAVDEADAEAALGIRHRSH